MILHYEFGGDDYHSGDEYNYEVSSDEVTEAVADYMADNYLYYLKKKHQFTSEQLHKLDQTKKVLVDAFNYTLKDFDIVTNDIEKDLEDIIHNYWENEAYKEWSSDNTPF